ncbi:ferric reductase [Jatrophihabitans fulvus]
MTTWYIARGAGLAALVLLTMTTALGALGSRRTTAPGRRYVLQYVHRAAAGLGLITLGLHLVTILMDPFAEVGWRGALVPFASGYRPAWIALGTVAVYLMLGVAALGLARGRLAASQRATRTWRGLHALGYAAWAAAAAHGFTSGSDSSAGWVRLIYVACIAAVATAVTTRLATRPVRTSDGLLVRPARTTGHLEGAVR